MKTRKKKRYDSTQWRAWFKGHAKNACWAGTEIAAIDRLAERHPKLFYNCAYVNPKPLKTSLYKFFADQRK